ncbi:MAG: 50S ribosomal protein L32e [Thermoplasmata archaeon]
MAEEEKEKKEAKGEEQGEGKAPSETKKKVEAKKKPQLSEKLIKLLALRNYLNHRRPVFLRQEWHRYKRLQSVKWRVPRGMHSKMRRHYGYRPNVVSIGYRGPEAVRGLHPSGFREVLVHNINELKNIDPKVEACRIARTVGMRKRMEIIKEAEKMGIRVLNPVKVRE